MERVTVKDILETGTRLAIEHLGSTTSQVIAEQAAVLANNPDFQELVGGAFEATLNATPEAAQMQERISNWIERQHPHGINAAIPPAAHSAIVKKIRSEDPT